jgi:hypothetical protein
MSQVLETPNIQDEACIAVETSRIPSPERAESVTAKTHPPITLLRSILSIFTGSKPEYIPKEYGPILERPELPLDYLCRTDPYLCMRTLSV